MTTGTGGMANSEVRCEDTENITLTPQELHALSQLDSRQYGFVLLKSSDNAKKRALVLKAVKYLQLMVIQARTHENDVDSDNSGSGKKISIDPKTWVKLGHFHLLLEEYRKALSAYQMFYKIKRTDHWMDPPFLYGLGLVYYHFNAYQMATKAFQQLLYVSPSFLRANEVHLRLGLMFKAAQEYESALKHLQLALADNGPCTVNKSTIKFHIALLMEGEGKIRSAKDRYELLLRDKNISSSLRSDIFRQLGWLYHCHDILGDKNQRTPSAIHCLQQAVKTEPHSGKSLYLLGRCYASIGKVHDAFIAYRNSVEKSESSASTWCSIGVLYQQQNQPMDALQAYICAVQLDKCHSAAWANLGILYESCGQVRDAYACYLNSKRGLSNQNSIDAVFEPYLPSKSPRQILRTVGTRPRLTQRINFLKTHLANAPMPSATSKRKQLLSIEEAWNLPISAEMSSRQQQQQSSTHQPQQSPAQTFQKSQSQTSVPQGQPPSYNMSSSGPSKRFKFESVEQKPPAQPPQPAFYLSQQQLQLLSYFQQNASSLTPTQQNTMQQLQHRHRLMQQHQQQMRQRASTGQSPNTGPDQPTHPAQFVAVAQRKNPTISQPLKQFHMDDLVQPVPVSNSARNLGLQLGSTGSMDVSEEDLQDLLSQKDLGATLAENLFEHFSSEDMDHIKEATESKVSKQLPSTVESLSAEIDSSLQGQDIKLKMEMPSPQ